MTPEASDITLALPFALLATLLYALSGGWQILVLLRQVPAPRLSLVRYSGIGAVLLHTYVLYVMLFQHDTLALGAAESTSLICWLMAIMLLLTSRYHAMTALMAILFPLASLSLILLIGLPQHVHDTHFSNGELIHIFTSVLAYALLSLATLQALLLAIQDRALKMRRFRGIVESLPALIRMERVLFDLITMGIILLTLSIITGVLFVYNAPLTRLTPKALLALMTWAIFGILLWGHRVRGWRGRKAVRWTLGGSVLLLLTYYGSKFLTPY